MKEVELIKVVANHHNFYRFPSINSLLKKGIFQQPAKRL